MFFNFKTRYGKKDHGPKNSDISEGYETDFSDIEPDSTLTLTRYDGADTATHIGKFFWHTAQFGFYAAKSIAQFVTHGAIGVYNEPENLKNSALCLGAMANAAAHAVDSAIDTAMDIFTGIKSVIAPTVTAGVKEIASEVSSYLFPKAIVNEIEMTEMTGHTSNYTTDDVELFGSTDDPFDGPDA